MIIKVESYSFLTKTFSLRLRENSGTGTVTLTAGIEDIDAAIAELKKVRLMLIGAHVGASLDAEAIVKKEDVEVEAQVRNILIGKVHAQAASGGGP